MSFRTRRVIFITPFYMLFEFFLLKYIFALFFELNDAVIICLAVFLGFIHVVPMLFEAKKSTSAGRFLSTVDGVWMWSSVMFLIDIIIIYLLGIFVKLPEFIIWALLLIVPVLGVYNYYKAHKLAVNSHTLEYENLSGDINIIHFSDVHFGSVRHREIISQISDKLVELESECDIAIISGDLADGSCVVNEDDFMEFKKVSIPIVFTPGNHDFYPGIENVINACKNAGIIVLDNDSLEYKNLNIYGLTYSFGDVEMPSLDEIKSKVEDNKINVMVYHVPYFWEKFSDIGFDLQLSGHTHGGQFYPVVNISNKMFEYNMGIFKNSCNKFLSVTTGVGSMDTPMRWGTDSELVILKLRKK